VHTLRLVLSVSLFLKHSRQVHYAHIVRRTDQGGNTAELARSTSGLEPVVMEPRAAPNAWQQGTRVSWQFHEQFVNADRFNTRSLMEFVNAYASSG
jgi:hypothetical protein